MTKKNNFVKNLGVQHIFNYKEQDFFEDKKINKSNLDMILDFVGGEYIKKTLNLLATEGKLINIGFQNGSKVDLNLIKVMLKRLIITGSTLRIRNTSNFKAKILKSLKKFIFPHFENGKLNVILILSLKLKTLFLLIKDYKKEHT